MAPGLPDAPLRLRPEIAQLGALTAYIEAFAERTSWAAADTLAFTLAAEELLANTVRHSDPPARSVEFALKYSGDGALATYSDDGAMFDPTTIRSQIRRCHCHSVRLAGWGSTSSGARCPPLPTGAKAS